MSGLSGCDLGMSLVGYPLLDGVVRLFRSDTSIHHRPAPFFPSDVLRNQFGSKFGIVVPPGFPQTPGADHVSPQGDAVSVRAAKVDRLLNRLLKETIRLAETRAAVSLLPLQGNEVEASIESNAVDWVLELSSFQVVFGRTASTGYWHVYQPNNPVMQVLLLLKSSTYSNSKSFGCNLGNPAQSEWTESDEAYWTAMDQCTATLAQQIVEVVFQT